MKTLQRIKGTGPFTGKLLTLAASQQSKAIYGLQQWHLLQHQRTKCMENFSQFFTEIGDKVNTTVNTILCYKIVQSNFRQKQGQNI